MASVEPVILMAQGGGVTSHHGCNTYVDLVVSNLNAATAEHGHIVDSFKAYAHHSQGDANFGYAQLDVDTRLKESLTESEKGQQLYMNLLEQMPAICVSNAVLGDCKNVDNVKIFPLKNLDKNPLKMLDQLYESINNIGNNSGHTLDKLEKLNSIVSFKPGMFGISLNANEIFKKWIEQKRQKNRKDRGDSQ